MLFNVFIIFTYIYFIIVNVPIDYLPIYISLFKEINVDNGINIDILKDKNANP